MGVQTEGVDTNDAGTGTVASLLLDLSTAGGLAGRFALAIGEFSASAATISINRSGWTALTQINVATTLSSRVFYKVLTAQDILDDTITLSVASATRCAAGVAVFSGVDQSSPLVPASPSNPATISESSNDQTNPFAGIDPDVEAFIVALQANNFAAGGTKVDWPSGWTKIFGEVGAHTSNRRPGVSCATYNGNPTEGNVLGGNTIPDVLSHSAAYTFALRPAAVAAPEPSGRFFPFI